MGWNHQLDNICVWGVFFFSIAHLHWQLQINNEKKTHQFIGNWPSMISGHIFTILKKVTFAELPGMDQWIMPYLPQSVYTVAFCLVELKFYECMFKNKCACMGSYFIMWSDMGRYIWWLWAHFVWNPWNRTRMRCSIVGRQMTWRWRQMISAAAAMWAVTSWLIT